MFDPVWVGNAIVPQWEAFAILFGCVVIAIVGFALVVEAECWIAIGVCWLARRLFRKRS